MTTERTLRKLLGIIRQSPYKPTNWLVESVDALLAEFGAEPPKDPEYPKVGTEYWILATWNLNVEKPEYKADEYTWDGEPIEKEWFRLGLVKFSKEEAEAAFDSAREALRNPKV